MKIYLRLATLWVREQLAVQEQAWQFAPDSAPSICAIDFWDKKIHLWNTDEFDENEADIMEVYNDKSVLRAISTIIDDWVCEMCEEWDIIILDSDWFVEIVPMDTVFEKVDDRWKII